jgi:hypothetical protein
MPWLQRVKTRYNTFLEGAQMAKTFSLLFMVMVSLLISTGCGAGSSAAPTEAPEMIYTRVAETIQANMTQTALFLPTGTTTPTVAPTQTPTSTTPPLPTIQGQTTGTGMVLPTVQVLNTPISIATSVTYNIPGDHARYLYNRPTDGYSIKAGQDFPLAFALENIGTTTWNTKYTWRFIGGTKCWDVTSVNLPKEVKPGERIEIFVVCIAPVENIGDYYDRWSLYTDTGLFVNGSEGYLFYTTTH